MAANGILTGPPLEGQPGEARSAGTARWLVPGLQSIAFALLLLALVFAGLSVYVALPLALAFIWLPLFFTGTPSAETPDDANADITSLTRDLSRTTSHNALSAAGVAFSVRQLAGKVQSQLSAAEKIVTSADVMIATEHQTAHLS